MIRLSVIGIFLGVVSEQMKRRIAPPFHLFILTVSSALFSQHHNDAAAQYGHGSPCLEVSTMFLSKHQNQNIQISAYLSHFFYCKNYFNFFVFMI